MSDLINRQDVIDAIKGLLDSMLETDTIGFYEIENVLFEVPSAERKGKWVETYEDDRKQIFWWECSECKYGVSWKANFCPNCGADMRPDNAPLADDDSIYG